MSRFLSLVTYYVYMTTRDLYGHRLTTGRQPGASYNAGVAALLRLHDGALESVSQAVALDPTFALGHAALALLGHEFCAPVDVEQRLRAARLHAGRATERERSHVHAVDRHVRGDSAPLVAHLEAWPADALLLSVAVPTIAFAGATSVPAEAWAIVERAAPAYGNDWWYAGLLAFMRQEQGRFDEAMDLARSSLAVEPAGGHAAHARAHAHYETGDHVAGLAWMDAWIDGDGQVVDKLEHFSWHAALHELSMGDLAAVARRYETQLAPRPALGCRALVDSGSLLWRWTLTPGVRDVPPVGDVLDVVQAADPSLLAAPKTAFMGMHAAVGLAAADDEPGLRVLGDHARRSTDPAIREVVGPLAHALRLLVRGRSSEAADALGRLDRDLWRVGGSDAQREVVEETRIGALLRAGRYDDARLLVDARLDRRRCRRDEWFWEACDQPER